MKTLSWYFVIYMIFVAYVAFILTIEPNARINLAPSSQPIDLIKP